VVFVDSGAGPEIVPLITIVTFAAPPPTALGSVALGDGLGKPDAVGPAPSVPFTVGTMDPVAPASVGETLSVAFGCSRR
jgi:hypothetical protein